MSTLLSVGVTKESKVPPSPLANSAGGKLLSAPATRFWRVLESVYVGCFNALADTRYYATHGKKSSHLKTPFYKLKETNFTKNDDQTPVM